MLAEGMVALWLMRPITPPDRLHGPSLDEFTDILCWASGDRLMVMDRWGGWMDNDLYCRLLNRRRLDHFIQGVIREKR
jgi:hypothetical protein